MANKTSRERSATSTLPPSRPLSAQSTRSNDSNATQPMTNGYFNVVDIPHGGYEVVEDHRRRLAPNLVAGAASMAWQPMHSHPAATAQYAVPGAEQHAFSFNGSAPHIIPHPAASFPPSFSAVNSGANSIVASIDDDGSRPGSKASKKSKKKKGTTQSEMNEKELRDIFASCQSRKLEDIAKQIQVETDEDNAKVEKTKQAYGLLWLHLTTYEADGSVPRGRVYSAYANSCTDAEIPLLNPASFGKLVRIIWPDIETRRLGNRGESKYHYCRMAIKGDNGLPMKDYSHEKPAPTSLKPRPSNPISTTVDTSVKADKSTPAQPSSSTQPLQHLPRGRKRNASTFPYEYSSSDPVPKRAKTMTFRYDWPQPLPEQMPADEKATQIKLPDMTPYLPKRADFDAINNLKSVYGNHLVIAKRTFRFVHTAQFMENIKGLYGLLTVPSQKLMTNPQMAPWIEACEKLKYHRLVELMRRLVMDQLPPAVMEHMETISKELCAHIIKCFGTQQQHLLNAVLRPAQVFAKLLRRFIRVNRTAFDAAMILRFSEARDPFYLAWAKSCDALSVVEENCDPLEGGHHRLLHMLTQEARFVLQPSEKACEEVENKLFDPQVWKDKQPAAALRFRAHEEELAEQARQRGEKPCNRVLVLQRLLDELPVRYAGVGIDQMISYASRVMGTVTCNMMLNQAGPAMQEWMTISIFIIQFLHWQAEVGGFTADMLGSPSTEEQAYLSPYESVEPSTQGAAQADLYVSEPSSGKKRKTDRHGNDADLQPSRAADGDLTDQDTTKRPRVSLGGETMVAEDEELPTFETNFDWSTEDLGDIKNFPGQLDQHLFEHGSSVLGTEQHNSIVTA